MFFNKQVKDINIEDVENLIESKIIESISLDYKREISASEEHKKEIVKVACMKKLLLKRY